MLGKSLIVSVIVLGAQAGQPAEKQKPAPPPATGVKKGTPAVDSAGGKLALTGITFTVPAAWKSQDPGTGPMAAKAVYSIPASKSGDGEGIVRITHYPEMKGKDDMNIDRWVGQVAKADGKPSTRADAKIEKTESGNIRITTVDLTGNVKITMKDTGKANQRMIAAIVDHPKGPHFVVAAGPEESMKTWGNDILGFIKSAKVTEP
jgi:hypothetical protein